MVSWGWLIVTFIVGGWCGFFAVAICNAARDNNKENEK